jgi:predicted negative regulator of RcsB-dependent stress response
MTKQSAFDKKHLETATLDQKKSILEELNLPPAVIRFVEKNKNNLVIAAACIVVIILGWTFYKNYTISQNDKAAAALSAAVKIEDETERLQAVEKVIGEFSSTDAALWAKLELAHSDYQASNFNEAITKYTAILADLNSDSNLVPLITYSLAYAYEQVGDLENALNKYKGLSKMSGFGGEGFLGSGRIYEKQNDRVNAVEAYEKYLAFSNENQGIAGSVKAKSAIEDKLAALKVVSSVAKDTSASEEVPALEGTETPAEETAPTSEAETK